MTHLFANPTSALAGKSVLVTGGLGFIGSNLTRELLRLGAHVTVLDALIPEHGGNWFNLDGVARDVRINISNMVDTHSLNHLVAGQDYIFHLAGQVSHGDSMRDPQTDLAVNCVSTMNLVEACRYHNPAARLVYTSTRQVYGIPVSLPVREDHPTVPIDVNGINKLAAEYFHLLYQRAYDIQSTVVRLTNTYGPRQQIRNNRQGFIGILTRQALRGESLQIFGSGEQVRDFNYVDDVVEALLLAAVHEPCYGKVWNLGAPARYSLLQFAKMLQELCGVSYKIVPFPQDRKLIDIGDYYGDYSAFNAATSWQPKVDLQEGLTKTVDFYRNHREAYWA